MTRVRVIRPNTTGICIERPFDIFGQAEEYVEGIAERLADRGWQLSELPGSSSVAGAIEATHDDYADIMLIRWEEVAS